MRKFKEVFSVLILSTVFIISVFGCKPDKYEFVKMNEEYFPFFYSFSPGSKWKYQDNGGKTYEIGLCGKDSTMAPISYNVSGTRLDMTYCNAPFLHSKFVISIQPSRNDRKKINFFLSDAIDYHALIAQDSVEITNEKISFLGKTYSSYIRVSFKDDKVYPGFTRLSEILFIPGIGIASMKVESDDKLGKTLLTLVSYEKP